MVARLFAISCAVAEENGVLDLIRPHAAMAAKRQVFYPTLIKF